MLIPKSQRIEIYKTLFSEGIMIAKKDFTFDHHIQLKLPNIHVIKTLQSLVSRGYVREVFCWQYYYWYLKDEGIQFLRKELHLSPVIIPETLKKLPNEGNRSDNRQGRRDYPARREGRRDDNKESFPTRSEFVHHSDEAAPVAPSPWK